MTSAMAEVVSYQPLTLEVQVWYWAGLYGVCDGQSGTETGFLALVLQFSSTINILPMLHTHWFICYQCCIIPAVDSIAKLYRKEQLFIV